MRNSSGSCNCVLFIVAAVILAAAFSAWVSLEFVNGNAPNMETAAWAVFGLGVFFLALLFAAVLTAAAYQSRTLAKCLCCFTPLLLASIFGAVLPALFALAVGIAPGITAIVVFTVIGSFSFALTVLGVAGLLYCVSSKLCFCIGRE